MVLERWRLGWGIRPWRPFTEELERRLEELLGRPFFPTAWRRLSGSDGFYCPASQSLGQEGKNECQRGEDLFHPPMSLVSED